MRFASCGVWADSASTSIPAPPVAPRPTAPRLLPPPRSAPHGSEIIALGTTVDGQAAATADRMGGIRLWTALDGTREPAVIQGTAAKSIALCATAMASPSRRSTPPAVFR